MNIDNPIFIVSTGRSGSKMIAKTLSKHPNLFAMHEPKPHMLTEGFIYWKNNLLYEKVKNSVKKKRLDLINQVKDNNLLYLESSHFCTHLIPILDDLYDAKFIHLYRDGREFVRSGLERNWYPDNIFSNSCSQNPFREVIRQKIRRKYLLDLGITFDDHKLEPPKKYTSPSEKITWLWTEINDTILNHLDDIPESRKLSIKLEEFGEKKLNQIIDFIDLEYSANIKKKMLYVISSKPNKTKNRKVALFENWDGKKKNKFWDIAEDMMQTLGYK